MKIYSLMQKEGELAPVEVEISLTPGLPVFQYLGLPDQHIKESAHRIQTALKSQGFEFPRGRRVLVNLRPALGKKTSLGLEFAIAASLLWETGQIPKPEDDRNQLLYGELSLAGEVIEPEDLGAFYSEIEGEIWTGAPQEENAMHFDRRRFESLRDLSEGGVVDKKAPLAEAQRPEEFLDYELTSQQAKLLKILAIGEHSSLFLGPAGTGKSTMARFLSALQKAPDSKSFKTMRKLARKACEKEPSWRPFVKPHHSVTRSAMIGGGSGCLPGEIVRSHGGILLLDEFFEYSSPVVESLREPMEEGLIRIARGGKAKTYACQSQVIATANLCPCGDWAPGKTVSCNYSIRKCQSYIERLSGPVLDRFQTMSFSHAWDKGEKILLRDLLAEVEEVRVWKASRGDGVLNAFKSVESCLVGLGDFERKELLPQFTSKRREASCYRVARTLADLDLSASLRIQHIEEALRWTVGPWQALKKWM